MVEVIRFRQEEQSGLVDVFTPDTRSLTENDENQVTTVIRNDTDLDTIVNAIERRSPTTLEVKLAGDRELDYLHLQDIVAAVRTTLSGSYAVALK